MKFVVIATIAVVALAQDMTIAALKELADGECNMVGLM